MDGWIQFEKVLVIVKVDLAVMQKVRSIVLIAEQVSFGFQHIPTLNNSLQLQTITIILHFAW